MKKNRQQRYKVFAFTPSVCMLVFFVPPTVFFFVLFVMALVQKAFVGAAVMAFGVALGLLYIILVCSLFQYVEFGDRELILKHRIFGIMKKIPYADMEIELLHSPHPLANFPSGVRDIRNNNLICFYDKKKKPKRFIEGGANIIGKGRFHVIFTPEFYQRLKEVLERQGYQDTLPEKLIFGEPKHTKWFAYHELFYAGNFLLGAVFLFALCVVSCAIFISDLSGKNIVFGFLLVLLAPLAVLYLFFAFLFYQRLYFEKDRLVIKMLFIGTYRTMKYKDMTVRIQDLKGLAKMFRPSSFYSYTPLYICIYDKTKKTKPFKRLGFNFSKRRLHLYYTKEVYDMLMERVNEAQKNTMTDEEKPL